MQCFHKISRESLMVATGRCSETQILQTSKKYGGLNVEVSVPNVGMMVGIFSFSNIFSMLYLRKSVLWAWLYTFCLEGFQN